MTMSWHYIVNTTGRHLFICLALYNISFVFQECLRMDSYGEVRLAPAMFPNYSGNSSDILVLGDNSVELELQT